MRFAKFTGIFACLCVILFIFGATLQGVALDRNFFNQEYKKLDVSAVTGMSEKEIERVNDNMLSYLDGKRDTLNMTAVIHSQEREVFNQKEKEHMADVRNLFTLLQNVKIGSLIAAGVLMLVTIVLSKKKSLETIARSYIRASIGFYAVILAMCAVVAIDFDFFWTQFHHIFFTNSLWLLDPSTDVLIQMMPSELFFDCVLRIIGIFLAGSLLLTAVNAVYLHYKKKRLKRNKA